VRRTPGYDGEYGVIRLFEPAELRGNAREDVLFEVPMPALPKQRKAEAAPKAPARRRRPQPADAEPPPPPIAPPASPHEPLEPMLAGMEEVGTGLLDGSTRCSAWRPRRRAARCSSWPGPAPARPGR
jgi:hypothetical protein